MKRKERKALVKTFRKGIRQSDLKAGQKTFLQALLLLPAGPQVLLDAVRDHTEEAGESFPTDWIDNLERLLQLFLEYAPVIIEIIERLFPAG